MGGEQSTDGKVVGYHVLRVSFVERIRGLLYEILSILQVQPNSPAANAGLEAFFDFIVAIGNNRLVCKLANLSSESKIHLIFDLLRIATMKI